MRTQLTHPESFSFVVLERQAITKRFQKIKGSNHLHAKRNLLWLGLCYTAVVVALIAVI